MSYNIPAPHSRLRPIPFSIDKSKWTLSNGVYTATYETPYITGTSVEWVEYSSTYRTSIRGDVDWIKANGGGGITFITTEQPVGTLEGVIKTIVNNDGRLTLVTQETALPTLRDVPFTLDVDDWTLNETTGMYEIVWETNYITATSHDWLEFDESIENATDAIKVDKAYDDGEVVGMKFISRRCPADDISGKITTLDNADGKIAVVLQDTVMPISAGGTGAITLAGAKSNLGITALEEQVDNIGDVVQLYNNYITTLSTNISVELSDDIDNYRTLMFIFRVNDNGWYSNFSMPVQIFKTLITSFDSRYYHMLNKDDGSYALIWYINDETIGVQLYATAYRVIIYGIK